MQQYVHNNTNYQVDEQGFLLNPENWDRNFAEGMAAQCQVPTLTSEHWDVITFLRREYDATGICPTILAVCRASGLRPRELQRLFPAGYHRGLCLLAGVHYRVLRQESEEGTLSKRLAEMQALAYEKVYRVDVRGFLIDPREWDAYYAMHRAMEMSIPYGRLADAHWRVIGYLRGAFLHGEYIPTIYETCTYCNLEIEELEALFPDGYHRGALKIAGLRFIR